jgi:hypothetical protein
VGWRDVASEFAQDLKTDLRFESSVVMALQEANWPSIYATGMSDHQGYKYKYKYKYKYDDHNTNSIGLSGELRRDGSAGGELAEYLRHRYVGSPRIQIQIQMQIQIQIVIEVVI